MAGPIQRIREKRNEAPENGQRIIFHELINSPHLSEEEKSPKRLVQEAATLIGPGGESTSQVLAAIAYFILADPDILTKLRNELRSIITSVLSPMPSLKQLEKLPYLVCELSNTYSLTSLSALKTGCCKEGLR